jgi:hypothetical protein
VLPPDCGEVPPLLPAEIDAIAKLAERMEAA